MGVKEQKAYGKKMRSHIADSSSAMQLLAELNLSKMSEKIIETISKNKKKLSTKKAYQATNDVKATGLVEYKRQVKILLGEIVETSWTIASDFVGLKAPITFKTEFEKLPKSVRDRITKTSNLLVDSQVADLEKNIFFKYDDAIFADLPDKEILANLEEASEKFYTGGGVGAGSSKIAAEFVNHSVSAYYALDDVANELEAFLYYNPDPKSAICSDLAGQYFPINDPNLARWTPPNHWNCKSTLIPVLKGQLPNNATIEKLAPSKAARKSVQFSIDDGMKNILEQWSYNE